MSIVIKVEMWRKAIVDASNISGLEPKHVANGRLKITDAMSDKLLSSNYSNIDEELVGMSDLVKDMISKLVIRTGGHCIIDNIREESSKHSLKTLQEKLLKVVLTTKVEVESEEEGKCMIKDRLCHSNVLILLDDVDDQSKIVEKLKLSYDGLNTVEKELFLDIACFFKGRRRKYATEILDTYGFHLDIGITVLIQKALITIDSSRYFDMHDLIQETGHFIIRGEHPDNPAKHSRV
uniref:Toll/interleukin-1 receptor (TIR) domain-containing protein n=1 Tax=Tanacetum cinerariifolium TaxID=118510 RepID=A0A6L2JRX2_TANCI|nr:Toll/interleukin-1 receptor (TIR) domain-containing protein [Tanacetum cinerariifolium]